jgi:hypothetical protein
VAISVRAGRSGALLSFDFRLDDPWDVVRLAEPAEARRMDRLWEHTCFEAFVAPAAGLAYWEVNLSSAGHWNVWRFDGYRTGMAPEDRIPPPIVATATGDGTLRLTATLDASGTNGLRTELAVGMAVVVEATDGTLSYWASAHPGTRPDFHARDGFALRLPAVRP